MRILLLSAYDTPSHRYWRESLVEQFSDYQWTVLHLPPRYFNFRVRTNSLSWLSEHSDTLSDHYSLILATSLVDITTLRGLVPSLSRVPLWLYCHENQFAYPVSSAQAERANLQHDLDVKMVFLYNCLSADWLSFNSEWNRMSTIQGVRKLLKAFPEKFNRDWCVEIQQKSDVLPVPLQLLGLPKNTMGRQAVRWRDHSNLQIVWNHRWEYDKGPKYLDAFVQVLAQSTIRATLHIVGQQFRQSPPAFSRIKAMLEKNNGRLMLGAFGYLDSQDAYNRCLEQSDVVLSTSLHDFQGLSVLEAVQRGCVPLLPDTLSYPELFDECFLYSWSDDPEVCAASAVNTLECLLESSSVFIPDLSGLEWPALQESYQFRIESLTSCRSGV